MKIINTKSESTRMIVDSYYERYKELNESNIDTIMMLISEDIEWNVPGDDNLAPWLGKRESKESVRNFFVLQKQFLESVVFDINKIMIDGEEALVSGYLSSRMLATNKIYDTPFMVHFVVKNNKITKYTFIEDTLELTHVLTDDTKAVEIVRQYFERGDKKDPTVDTLFADDVEIFYPKFGERKGREQINIFSKGFGKELESLIHQIDDFQYIVTGDRVIVEGTESGKRKNGTTFTRTRFVAYSP